MTDNNKPPYGSPCNGCGACCLAEQCYLSLVTFGQSHPCPAIIRDGGRFACGLVERPDETVPDLVRVLGSDVTRRVAALLVGAGLGCDSRMEGEPDNPEWRRTVLGELDWEMGQRLINLWVAALWAEAPET